MENDQTPDLNKDMEGGKDEKFKQITGKYARSGKYRQAGSALRT